MKIAKKTLSMFLSLLMIFSACSVGLTGIVASAAAGDSKYTHDEVVDFVNAATANGFTISSSGNAWNYTADDGSALAAAEAIFDYAVKEYRVGKKPTDAGNSSKALEDTFNAEFGAKYANATAAQLLVKNVLNPVGTDVYGYEEAGVKTTTLAETTNNPGDKGTDVTANYPLASYPNLYVTGAASDVVTKTSFVQLDMNKYLMTFDSIDDIPSSFLTSVKYTYAHVGTTSATLSDVTTRDAGSGCNKTTYYTPTITTSYWNYMTAKPVRQVVKNTTAKKQLLSYEKYFNEELYVTTREDMLAMPLDKIQNLYNTTKAYYDVMIANFSPAVIDHFNLDYSRIASFMADADYAYRAVAAIHNIDVLNNYISSEYNENSYSEMSSLYSKVNTAYNVVYSLKNDTIDYIISAGYASEYDSALTLKATAESYIKTLYEIMTEQRLEELVASMVKTFEDYINVLDKENIDEPTDAEISGLVQKADSYDSVLAQYTGKAYYRNYWSTAYESEWTRFRDILAEVAEVRDLKSDVQTYYDYFMPVLFTNMIVDSDNDTLVDLHKNMSAQIQAVRDSYNAVGAEWGYTIADKIFTIEYEGADSLLQTILDSAKSTGLTLIKDELVSRTEAMLDAVEVYKGVTEVNFDNFAEIKSTLSHFDYDMYDYVAAQSGWLSADYIAKYANVATVLANYHLFSTNDGEKFFNENFTFADENGIYATRYAGNQTVEVEGEDEDGNPVTTTVQIGYPSDIARDGAEDNYYVTEEVLLDTVVRIDNFITSRDFGALVGLVDENEEPTDLATYLLAMLDEMLYTDDMMNTLVGMIFPMVVQLIEEQLVGAIAGMDGGGMTEDGIPYIDLNDLISLDGQLQLYLDNTRAPSHGEGDQKDFPTVFAELGLYIYPATLADSLAISNPAFYGVGSDIYNALKAAGRDWTALVNEEEGLALDFEWGVYDKESFLDTLACVLDSILPLLQTALSTSTFEGAASNAAVAYSPDLLGMKIWIRGGLGLTINPLNVYNASLVPLFEALGIENIPTLGAECASDEIVNAVFGTLLDWIEDVLKAPLSTILDILPNLVYFLSMDSVQEIIDGLNINLNLRISEVEVLKYSGGLSFIIGPIVDGIDGMLADQIKFDVGLNLAKELDLYDLLGFEISDFNEILTFALSKLGADISLPPIRQQELIFCSDWGRNAAGRVDLQANKGDVMYWFLDYVITALGQEGFLDAILGLIGGEDGVSLDGTIGSVLNRVVYAVTSNPDGALAAIVELLNPVEYSLTGMNWIDGTWNYDGIEGANQMSIVYLNNGNDWNREKAEYLADNIDSLVETILTMVGTDFDDLGVFLSDKINGLFTNANITALVKMLGGLGDSASAVIEDIVEQQIGINLESWFIAFGYLFPAETWKEDAEIIQPDSRYYINEFGITGVANEDGTITWSYNGVELADGDSDVFVDILTALISEASLLVEFLFGGADVAAFEDLLTIKGYESFDASLGLLLDMLGVTGVPTQADFTADAVGSLNTTLHALLDWLNALLASDTMIKDLVELLPDLFYFIESNGLSTLLHNLLMPILVLVDTVRPLIDVDINGVLSLIVSDILNYGTIDLNVILQYIIDRVYVNDDLDYKWYAIDINNITVAEIIKLVDGFLGTNLYESGLVDIGIKGLCSGVVADGNVYRPTVDAADTMTILVTALLDCLSYPTADGKTNGDVLFGFVAELTGNEKIAGLYPVIAEVIAGIEYEYGEPNWGYMFESVGDFSLILPEQSIVYLGYSTDWTEETADTVYDALDEILDLVLPMVLEENETIGTLLNGLLEDNVYSDEILNTLVELIVNALASLDASLFELVDVVVDTDIATWFTFCEYDEVAEEYVCTYDWNVDEAADKKAAFIAGLKDVLAPANSLLAWLFFGTEYAFFTGSETDDEGNYVYNDIITLNGGEGYAYGLAPIFEALGCTVAPADTFYDEATGTYNVADAVEALLNSVFALVDEISANPAEEVFNLLPNLIYFLNADGIKASVSNLLAPVNAIIEKLAPIISEDGESVSIGGLLADTIGLDIENITTETLLGLAADAGVKLSPEMVEIIANLYVGKLAEFTSANGRKAYKLDIEGYEGDVLTIVLSIALDAFKLNGELFSGLLGEDVYLAVMNLLAGATAEFEYADPNWAYMYGGDVDKLLAENLPAPSDVYLQYANDWNELTAETLSGNLGALVEAVFEMIGEDSTIGEMLQAAVAGNLYKDDILDSLLETVVGLLVGLDETIVNAAGAALGAEVDKWIDEYCTVTTDETTGEVVVECTYDWGIDNADNKEEAFVAAFTTALEPINRVLAWLLFGQDYTFFNGTTSEELITITGGEGYAYALVPLFEALGCEMNSAYEYLNEDGSYDAAGALGDVIAALCGKITELCSGTSGETVDAVINMLPNIIYFISADGAKTVVNNLLNPVMFLLETLEPLVEVDLVELIGFDIFNINWDTVFALLADELGVTLTDDAVALIKNFYIGSVEAKTSANGRQYFYMTADAAAKRDMITIILSVALETLVLDSNKDVFVDLMGEDIYNTIVTVIAGAQTEFEYADINWAYMYEGEDALAQLIANNLPARTPENTIVYTQYTNNWNKETADYLAANLSTIVNAVISTMSEEGSSIGAMLEAAIAGNLYKDDVLNSLLETVVELLAGLDYVLVDSVGALLSADIDAWFGFCEITRDADGKVIDVVCTKDWGIDNAENKAEAFVNAIVEALAPANRVLAWLFFGQDYTFLNNANGDNLITISGGNGYAEGLAPLLEALGCTMKPAATYYVDGELDMSAAVRDIFTALCNRITDVCSDDAIGVVLDLLPNLIYFINADGAKVVVNNLLQPAYFLLEKLSPLVGEINLDELVGFPISDIDFNAVFEIVGNEFGIYFPEKIQNFITSFYLGEVEQYTAANGEAAFRMVYSDTETRAEMLTILVSLVIDVFRYEENAKAFADLLGSDVYNAIMSVLELKEAKAMQEFDWLYTEYADTDKTFTAIESSQMYTATYNEYWTKDKAQTLVDRADDFILNILHVLNLEIDGVKMDSVEAVIDSLISDLYSQANADAILTMVKDFIAQLSDLEPYGDLLKTVLKAALGVDLTAWDNMVVTVEDGNRDSFSAAIGQILAPVVPVLEILLTGKDVSFFLDIEGADAITIFGSEGYAYGIIPLLEALGCEGVLTPAEYKAAVKADTAAAITAIINPLFDKIDEIAADPINEVLELLPAVIYFINSNGLDTVVKNVLNSVDTVLAGLEPLIGVTSIVDLLGIDLSTYNFDYLFNMLIDMAAESTGFELTAIAGDAVAELTVGRVVSYQSKNGETYYTMQYASDRDKADMVTVLLRLIVDFVTADENIKAIEGMLEGVITDEETFKSVCSILESLAAASKEDPSIGKGVAALYYIFVVLDGVAEGADDIYHDVTNSWSFILKMLETSEEPVLREFARVLKSSLNKYFGTEYEETEKEEIIKPESGIARFFQKIADFFRKIGEFFRNLFGMN